MSDVKCPYCGKEQEINHDDGYGYEEDKIHHQYCRTCRNTFTYTTTIIFHYDVSKADCLNGGEHKFKPEIWYPRQFSKMVCETCEESRKPTEQEMELILSK